MRSMRRLIFSQLNVLNTSSLALVTRSIDVDYTIRVIFFSLSLLRFFRTESAVLFSLRNGPSFSALNTR